MTSLEKIEEIVNRFKEEDLINFACISGSYAIPYIKNNNDYDLLLYAKPQMKDILQNLVREYYNRKDLMDQFKIDIHVRDENYHILNTLYAFEDRFIIPIGYNEDIITRVDILDNISKAKENILRIFNTGKITNEYKYTTNVWYYIYSTCCIIKENSYELTTEEIENINILHDREEKDLDKRQELIDNMIKEIELWQI